MICRSPKLHKILQKMLQKCVVFEVSSSKFWPTNACFWLCMYISVMFAPSKVSMNQQLESGIMQDRSISENCTILNLAFEMRLKILCVSLIKNENDGHISIVTLGSFGWWHWVKIPSERIQRPNLTVKFKIWRFSFRPSWDLPQMGSIQGLVGNFQPGFEREIYHQILSWPHFWGWNFFSETSRL